MLENRKKLNFLFDFNRFENATTLTRELIELMELIELIEHGVSFGRITREMITVISLVVF